MNDGQVILIALAILLAGYIVWSVLQSRFFGQDSEGPGSFGGNDPDENASSGPSPESPAAKSWVTFTADGVTEINTGAGVLRLNAPTGDPDPDEPCDDPLDVAARVVDERGRENSPDFVDMVLVDALTVLHRADASEDRGHRGKVQNADARVCAELAAAVDVEDEHDAFAAARSLPLATTAQGAIVEAFLGPRWPVATAQLFWELGIAPRVALSEAVARADPALCDRMLADLPSGEAVYQVGSALLAAIDARQPADQLAQRFKSLSDVGDSATREEWEELELRRLSRSDLDQALTFFKELRQERGVGELGIRSLVARLAQQDKSKALALAEPYLKDEPFDGLPYVR